MRTGRALFGLCFCLLWLATAPAQSSAQSLAQSMAQVPAHPADAGAPRQPPDCAAPDDMTRFRVQLPNTVRAIRHGGELTVVAIGSSSTEGVGASEPARSYPSQLATALARTWPRLKIRVINKGIGGEDATGMLRRFEGDVLPYDPQLVIWQVGSNYALRDRDMEAYAAILSKGINRLKAANIDVVLMDLQYAPRVLDKPAHRRVLDTMGTLSGDLKVAMFRRFEIMRHWVSSGGARMEDVLAPDRLHMNDASYACIGRLLAENLTAAASIVQPTAAPTDTAAAR